MINLVFPVPTHCVFISCTPTNDFLHNHTSINFSALYFHSRMLILFSIPQSYSQLNAPQIPSLYRTGMIRLLFRRILFKKPFLLFVHYPNHYVLHRGFHPDGTNSCNWNFIFHKATSFTTFFANQQFLRVLLSKIKISPPGLSSSWITNRHASGMIISNASSEIGSRNGSPFFIFAR